LLQIFNVFYIQFDIKSLEELFTDPSIVSKIALPAFYLISVSNSNYGSCDKKITHQPYMPEYAMYFFYYHSLVFHLVCILSLGILSI